MRNNWKTKRLGDVLYKTENINPKLNPDKEFVYIDISSVSNKTYKIENPTTLKGKDAPSRARKKVKSGDIIYATVRPTLKRVAVIPEEFDDQVCSTGYFVIRHKEFISNEFLFYYLISDFFNQNISELQKGASYPAINENDLKNQTISFPESLDEQGAIVEELKLIDSIRSKRSGSIALLEKYLESIFLEIFGDPITNPKGWEIRTLQDLTTKLGDGLHGTPIYDESGDYFFINGNNLENGEIIIKNSTKRVSQSEFEKYKKPLNESSVLVSINGTLGRVGFYKDEKIVLGKSVCYFNIKQNQIDSLYLYFVLKSNYFLKYTIGNSTGSTIQNVSLKTMRNFPMMLPPLSHQKQFAEIVEKVESVKQKMIIQSEGLETQFQSLMQSSFSVQ